MSIIVALVGVVFGLSSWPNPVGALAAGVNLGILLIILMDYVNGSKL